MSEIKFDNLTQKKQVLLINTSYDIAKKYFYLIDDDVVNNLNSYVQLTSNFNEIRKEIVIIMDRIVKELTEFKNPREYAQGKNNYLKVFSLLAVKEIDNITYSDKLILIFLGTYFYYIYYENISYNKKEIKKSRKFIEQALKGNLFGESKKAIKIDLEMQKTILDLRKGKEEYFFFKNLSIFGSMGIEKNKLIKGFADKFKMFSTKRESMDKAFKDIPNFSVDSYMRIIKENNYK